jgi:hypothetical protein
MLVPGYQRNQRVHARQDVRICGKPYKEYFDEMCFCPVLDGDGVYTYWVSDERRQFTVLCRAFSDQGRPGPEVEIRYAPRSSTPQAKSFRERKRVALAVEVVQVGIVESSKEFFSSKLFVGPSILRMTLEQGEEG